MGILEKFSLAGKRAVVTGCSRGIGFGIAEALAQAGADIIGVSASMSSDGGEIGTRVRAEGRSFHALKCDFSNPANAESLAGEIISSFGVPDILFNNAGTIKRAPAAEHSDEFWFNVINVNLNSQFFLSRGIGREMLKRGSGKIIFTASLLTFQGGINVPSYAASKGGVGQLTKALANEWAGKGVNVNAIAPGYIATDNTAALRADKVRSGQILERIPAGRWGTPDDLKGAAVFLASSASDYVNGEIITVDGGWMAR